MAIKVVLAALAMSAMACANSTPQVGRNDSIYVADGFPARLGDVPFIVSIQAPKGKHRCGGSLLDAYTVVTAAHCITGIKDLRYAKKDIFIRAGSLYHDFSFGGVTSAVDSTVAHPNFEELDHDDVGIIKLTDPIHNKGWVEYAVLAASGQDPVVGTNATIAGWGLTEYGQTRWLQTADTPILSRRYCSNRFDKVVDETEFCAGRRQAATCKGDSGGPIFEKNGNVLIGVVAWGYIMCREGLPSEYTRIGALRDFIDKYVDSSN